MRTAALYEYKREAYLDNLEPLKEDLNDRAMHYFFNDKNRPETWLGEEFVETKAQ